tara:strand:+ start:579 stop:1016 length:438 start_codon:yes stop_codon:yes gene_type:complete
MAIHMIKLVVGVNDLDQFLEIQKNSVVDYDGQAANMVWTRFKPKRAEEILDTGGSIYRVIKNRIQCRQKILGFDVVETKEKGTQCLIMVEPGIIQTISKPKRPFQGWRYLQAKDAPKDRGIYLGDGQREEIPPEMEDELKEAGLL